MLSSIHPLGERAKHNRYWLTATAFVVGALAGGAAVGAILGAAGTALATAVDDRARLVGLAVVAVGAFLAEWRGIRLPAVRRQVDENWLQEFRGWVYGLGFGLQLGAGVATIITTAALYVALAASVAVGSIVGGVAVMATFGVVRGLSLLAGRRIETPERLVTFHRTLQSTAPAVHRASTSVLAVAALGAAVTVAVGA